MPPPMRYGTVAIVGRTNVGKSTFLNASLGEKLAIVSPLPQTTRDELLGIVHLDGAQIAFTDTPGLHRPKTELGRRMNAQALDTLRDRDVVLFVSDVGHLARRKATWRPDQDPIPADDRRLLKVLPKEAPVILILNKVDLSRGKEALLPLMEAYGQAHSFAAMIPTCLLKQDGVDQVLKEIVRHLPERAGAFSENELTNKPALFFVREYVREQVMLQTRREVPHAVAVTVDQFDEREEVAVIHATLHVDKAGQRSILVGKGGQRIKEIGTNARAHIESLLDKRVHLELFVRVTENWRDIPRQLRELGYVGDRAKSLSNVLPQDQSSRPKKKPNIRVKRSSTAVTKPTPTKGAHSNEAAGKKASNKTAGKKAPNKKSSAKKFAKKTASKRRAPAKKATTKKTSVKSRGANKPSKGATSTSKSQAKPSRANQSKTASARRKARAGRAQGVKS